MTAQEVLTVRRAIEAEREELLAAAGDADTRHRVADLDCRLAALPADCPHPFDGEHRSGAVMWWCSACGAVLDVPGAECRHGGSGTVRDR